MIGLLAWGASGVWAGDGIVALQTAAASCANDSGDRYVDCGNGTVADNDTGLVWLQNANCIGAAGGGTGDPLGAVDWYTAMEFVAGLSDLPGDDPDDCGLEDGSSPGEWRLASKAEWQEMISEAAAMGCSDSIITNDSRTDCWDQDCVDLGACSFAGVQSGNWSSSSSATVPAAAYFTQGIGTKTRNDYVWPVRGGQ